MMGPMSLEYGRRAWTCPAMTNDAARAARTHAAGEAGPRVTELPMATHGVAFA